MRLNPVLIIEHQFRYHQQIENKFVNWPMILVEKKKAGRKTKLDENNPLINTPNECLVQINRPKYSFCMCIKQT